MRLEVISLWRRLWDGKAGPPLAELVEPIPLAPHPFAEPVPLAQVVEPPNGIERRAAVRRPCHREAWLHTVTLVKNLPWHAIVLDLSTHGIGLAIERPVLAGTFFAVELPDTMLAGPPKVVRARVVHARPQSHNYWQLGCVFEVDLTPDEVEARSNLPCEIVQQYVARREGEAPAEPRGFRLRGSAGASPSRL